MAETRVRPATAAQYVFEFYLRWKVVDEPDNPRPVPYKYLDTVTPYLIENVLTSERMTILVPDYDDVDEWLIDERFLESVGKRGDHMKNSTETTKVTQHQ